MSISCSSFPTVTPGYLRNVPDLVWKGKGISLRGALFSCTSLENQYVFRIFIHMEAEKKGVFYRLFNFKSASFQTVRFTEKVDGEYIPGTTNEEVVDMLVDRFEHLNQRSWSVENELVLSLLRVIKQTLRRRLSRKIQNVNKFNNGQ